MAEVPPTDGLGVEVSTHARKLMPEFQSRFWDWFRDVRIGEDHLGRVRLEYGEQVKVFGHEEPIGEVLEELRRLDLKVLKNHPQGPSR